MTPPRAAGRPPLLSPQGLAEQLDVPVSTVYQWRTKGIAPPAVKVGRHLRFRQDDVDRWLEARTARGTGRTPAA